MNNPQKPVSTVWEKIRVFFCSNLTDLGPIQKKVRPSQQHKNKQDFSHILVAPKCKFSTLHMRCRSGSISGHLYTQNPNYSCIIPTNVVWRRDIAVEIVFADYDFLWPRFKCWGEGGRVFISNFFISEKGERRDMNGISYCELLWSYKRWIRHTFLKGRMRF